MNDTTPAHWDPEPSERIYYRSAKTGNLGWLVRREGADKIRLDRAMQEIIIPFNKDEWDEERHYKPFSRTQVSLLAFEADKLLCRMLGQHERSRKEWLSLSDKERISWMEQGPGPDGLRGEVYAALFGVLGKHAR